jgi:hypothetical protein
MICFVPIVLVLLWIWLRFITRYPERTVRDVYPFFHLVEDEILVGSFHPSPEEEFRANHSNEEFKLWQSKRIHLAIHLCRHISANSRLLQRWAIHERKLSRQSPSREIREGLRAFQIAAMHSRTAAFAVRFRLRLRLIRMTMLPFLPVPSFRTLLEHSNDLIEFYRTAEVLAESFSRMYDEEIHQNMLAVLGTVDLELDGLES